jgi:nucleotide-binding universal stress UspA family protein
MVQIGRILVPTDFSEPSAKALGYGKALARLFGADLHVLHVINARPFAGTPPAEGYIPELPEFMSQLETIARATMSRLVERAGPEDVTATTAIRWGRPHVEIGRYAREHDIALVVMGTHGRGVVGHLLMGSVAERVVRTAPCPVLTVREREHDFVLPDAGDARTAAVESLTEKEGGRLRC